MTIQDLETIGKAGGGLVAIAGAIWAIIKYMIKPISKFGADFSYAVTKSVDGAKEMEAAFGNTPGQTIKGLLQELSMKRTVDEIQRNMMASHLGLGLYICSPDGKCLYANDVLCEIFGRDLHDMVDFGWLASIEGSERLSVHQVWMDCIKSQLPYNCTYTVVNPRTKARHSCSTMAVPVKAGSVVTAYVGSLVDLKRSGDS